MDGVDEELEDAEGESSAGEDGRRIGMGMGMLKKKSGSCAFSPVPDAIGGAVLELSGNLPPLRAKRTYTQ